MPNHKSNQKVQKVEANNHKSSYCFVREFHSQKYLQTKTIFDQKFVLNGRLFLAKKVRLSYFLSRDLSLGCVQTECWDFDFEIIIQGQKRNKMKGNKAFFVWGWTAEPSKWNFLTTIPFKNWDCLLGKASKKWLWGFYIWKVVTQALCFDSFFSEQEWRVFSSSNLVGWNLYGYFFLCAFS